MIRLSSGDDRLQAPDKARPRASLRLDADHILCADEARGVLEVKRVQRELVRRTCRETLSALASALESKDTCTGAHSQRVRCYAMELAQEVDSALCADESVEYGFLLHDVGKIGIPDRILQKRGPLTASERRLIETHAVIGEQLLNGVSLLHDHGLQIVRNHHERWDGGGYPDGLAQVEIPVGARVFAVADALDAMTSDRPYRRARTWEEAAAEIARESGRQFDPQVVDAFRRLSSRLRRIHYERAGRS